MSPAKLPPGTIAKGMRLVGPHTGSVFEVARTFAFDDGTERAELVSDGVTITMTVDDLLDPALGWTVAPPEVKP